MDAKLTSPPKTGRFTANTYDRAASTIPGAMETNPPWTGRPWVGAVLYAAHRPPRRGCPRAVTRRDASRRTSIFAAQPHVRRSQRFCGEPSATTRVLTIMRADEY
jgi:hypothetical protein